MALLKAKPRVDSQQRGMTGADPAAAPRRVDHYIEAIRLSLDVPDGRVTDKSRDRIKDGHPATRPFVRRGPLPETDLVGAMRIGLDEKASRSVEF